MWNTNNNNIKIQTSSALHNAIMKAGGKDHPPMLAPDKIETKDIVYSCLVSKEQEIQKLQEKARLSKGGCMKGLKALQSHFTSLSDDLKDFGRENYNSQMTSKYFVEYTGIEVKYFIDTLLQHMGNVKKYVAKRTRHQRQYDRRVNKRQMQMQESKVDTGKALDVGLVVIESSGTKSEVQDESSRNQSVVTQPNAFKSERPNISKPRFASQVDVEKDFFKARNSYKNMPRFSSNDMVHNHYLAEAKKKTQARNRNSKPSVMHFTILQNTTNDSKPKPRSNNQTSRSFPTSKSSCVMITAVPVAEHSRNSGSFLDSKHFVCSTCQKCVFNANHDACITKFLHEVNLRAKIQSYKTRNSSKPVKQKSHTQKPIRQIFTRHRFSPNRSFTMYEKTSPRSDLRWKPTGRISKTIGLRWVPTRKIFASCTSKADSNSTHGSNVDILNICECKQTLKFSAGTSINVQEKQSINLSAGTSYNVKHDNLRV
nr:hypothetical protein [Tanacetum cinerariifolium]